MMVRDKMYLGGVERWGEQANKVAQLMGKRKAGLPRQKERDHRVPAPAYKYISSGNNAQK